MSCRTPPTRLCQGYSPIPPRHGALCSPQCGELEVHSSLGHTLASVCHSQSPLYRGGSRVQGRAASPCPADVLRAPVPPCHLWFPYLQACSFDLHLALFFCLRLLVPPEPHLHLMISALRLLSPSGGSGIGRYAHSSMCTGRACSLGAAPPQHTRTPQQTGAPLEPLVLSAWWSWGGDSLDIPASPCCST